MKYNISQIKDAIAGFKTIELDEKKIAVLLLTGLLLVYLDAAFIIKSQFRAINKTGAKITKLKKDTVNLRQELTGLSKTRPAQGEDIKAKKLISEGQFPSLLERISSLANQYKVKIMQIKPSKAAAAKDEIVGGKSFSHTELVLNLSCGYHQLGSFINALENDQIFIAVEGIKILPSMNDYLSQEVNLTLKTYVRK